MAAPAAASAYQTQSHRLCRVIIKFDSSVHASYAISVRWALRFGTSAARTLVLFQQNDQVVVAKNQAVEAQAAIAVAATAAAAFLAAAAAAINAAVHQKKSLHVIDNWIKPLDGGDIWVKPLDTQNGPHTKLDSSLESAPGWATVHWLRAACLGYPSPGQAQAPRGRPEQRPRARLPGAAAQWGRCLAPAAS